MNPPSEEQQHIIDHVKAQSNVIVDACAGSGKSTTILSCALYMPEARLLQLTYNKTLRHEIREKIEELKLTNIDVHTYHSLAYNYYHHDGQMDNGIRRIIRENLPLKYPIVSASLFDTDTTLEPTSTTTPPLPNTLAFDILVVDEAQDMTHVYFMLLHKFVQDCGRKFQLLVLGDKKQGLYEFKGADIRFLTLAHSCWHNHPLLKTQTFAHCTLQTSYRITKPMADFVNVGLLDSKRLHAVKSGPPVHYMRREHAIVSRYIAAQITELIETGSKFADIYILCASLKAAIARDVENILVDKNIPCYLSTQESQEQLDNRIIHNKVVFSTFHCVKGRQRKHVFVLGFDETYFRYYARKLSLDECPNTLYVACTRGLERLYVFEKCGRDTDAPLPFLKLSHSAMAKPTTEFVKFLGNTAGLRPAEHKQKAIEQSKQTRKQNITVSDILRFLSESVLDTISPVIDKIFVKIDTHTMKPYEDQAEEYIYDEIEIPGVKETRSGHYEDVSDINGIVMPMLFYDALEDNRQRGLLQHLVRMAMTSIPLDKHKYLHNMVDTMPEKCETIEEYLFVANLCIAVQERLYSKLKQLREDEYDWLTPEMVSACVAQFERVVGPFCHTEEWQAEFTIVTQNRDEDHFYIDKFVQNALQSDAVVYRIGARADLMTTNTLWEMKCTTNLTIEHKMQLVWYMWLWYMQMPSKERMTKQYKTGYLFNVKTGELLQLQASMEELNLIVREMIKDKFKEEIPKTDPEFLQHIYDTRGYPVAQEDESETESDQASEAGSESTLTNEIPGMVSATSLSIVV